MATRTRMAPDWVRLLLVSALLGCELEKRSQEPPESGPNVGEPAAPADQPEAEPDFPVGPRRRCLPTGGDAHWTIEGETLSIALRCATGEAGPASRFSLSPVPRGATLDADATLHWTPGLDQAGVYELTIVDAVTQETGTLKIGVADDFANPDNAPVDPFTYTEELGLPVVHLFYFGELIPEVERPVRVVYRGHEFLAAGKLRGATSLDFPKKSYTLEFPDDDRFTEPHAVEGFVNRRKIVLITSFNDNSYIRPRLSFELWRRMDASHIGVKVFNAVVFVNGQYRGLYSVADHVNKRLLEAHGISRDDNLYKAINLSANFSRADKLGRPKDPLYFGFEKKNGLPPEGEPGAFDDLVELIAFVADSDPETFRTELPRRLDLREYQDWWIFVSLLNASNNKSRNAYHVHSPRGGPWRYLPWDLDATFGQEWDTERERPEVFDDFRNDNLLFKRMLEEPAFAGPMRARYQALLRGELKVDTVLALLDRYAAEVGPAARRDESRWMPEYRSYELWSHRTDFTTFDEEIRYMREWISTRWRLLETSFPW